MDTNTMTAKSLMAALFFLCSSQVFVDSAAAHRVNVFAWVEGDTIHVEGKFGGGKSVKAGKILVTDTQGHALLSGLTNDHGEFSFKVPQRTDLKIILSAGQGHQGEWTIRAAEMPELPAAAAGAAKDPKSMPSASKENDAASPADGMAAANTGINREELEAIIATVMDRKLKPIIKMLADAQQKGPSLRDILAGIGYIFGLAGIAAYIHRRKTSK